MENAKIQLSAEEIQMIRSTDWVFTRKSIIAKVYELFGGLAAAGREQLSRYTFLPAPLLSSEPKISRGEQYRELPYVILDYPKVFGKDGVLALRTMFWWGKYFSVTLHISGQYKQQYQHALIRNSQIFRHQYCCLENFCSDEWEHAIEAPWFLPVNTFSTKDLGYHIEHSPFMKIAVKQSFDQWEELPKTLLSSQHELLKWLD